MSNRREFIKKAGYAAPVILTMAAKPSFASSGSAKDEVRAKGKKSKGKKKKKAKSKRRGRNEAA